MKDSHMKQAPFLDLKDCIKSWGGNFDWISQKSPPNCPNLKLEQTNVSCDLPL